MKFGGAVCAGASRPFFGVNQVEFVRVEKGLPTGVDDVAADADGAEGVPFAGCRLAAAFHDDADFRGGFFAGVGDAHLVVGQVDVGDGGIVCDQGCFQSAV